MKSIIILATLAILTTFAACCTGNELRVLNLDYVQPSTGNKIHTVFKYGNMTLKYHVLNDSDVDETVFKFIWNYSSEEEKTKGHELLTQLGADFDEMREDSGFLIVFFGKHVKTLKFYKRTEFGSAYTIDITQKDVTMQLQFQIKKEAENQDEFHSVIEKIVEKRQPQIKQVLEFLQ